MKYPLPVALLFLCPPLLAADAGRVEEWAPVLPKPPQPRVIERVVEKPVKDPATERRAHAAETDSRNKDAEIARLKAELDKARKQPPKVVERVVEKVVEKPVVVAPLPPVSPVSANDPAAACWQNGAWQAACGFAAYAGGPVFRVVGGNLSFTMGTRKGSDGMAFDNEDPPRSVSFQRRFALAETEVTVAQYLACVQDGACKEPEWREAGSRYHYKTGSDDYYTRRNALQPTSPITGVSWNDAKAYVAWLSRKAGQTYMMPTEAQWEYAARGGQSGRWYFGDTESQLKDHAWYGDNAGGQLHPVGSTRLNTHPWGLKDMAGNAWEWVEDCWHGSYTNAPSSGDKAWEAADGGDCGLRVLRGGSWCSGTRHTRAAFRDRYSSDIRSCYVSFRPSRMLP